MAFARKPGTYSAGLALLEHGMVKGALLIGHNACLTVSASAKFRANCLSLENSTWNFPPDSCGVLLFIISSSVSEGSILELMRGRVNFGAYERENKGIYLS